ncbi:hypothetical protein [Roseateles chitinivorans]|uniref:hypothetical protein n=1 Tax=Roseateles chitinivorans TaxID=2917965 RepID=UPI003D679693
MERRDFLKIGAGTGGAFVASFCLPLPAGAAKAAKSPTAPAAASFEPNVYIRIAPSGKVTYVIPFVEMGQGSFTAIPMMLAEEMDIPSPASPSSRPRPMRSATPTRSSGCRSPAARRR